MIEVEKMFEKYPMDPDQIENVSVLSDIELTLPLLASQALLDQMETADIDKTVIYAVEAPIVYASNEYVSALCNEFPDKLIGFASVDPLASNASETLKEAVNTLGLKGLKLHPPLQNFFPNDERVFPVYETASNLNIPVVFHVGTTPFGAMCRLSQADPLLIDDVAVAFPDLRIMLTHLGTLWHHGAFMVVEKNPNVFIDTAAYLYEIPKILTNDLIGRIGAEKIIFGTDYPMPFAKQIHNMKAFVDCINGLDIGTETKDRIFHRNFELLLEGRTEKTSQAKKDDIIQEALKYGTDTHKSE